MSVNKFIEDPLWATLVGALVAAMGVSFFVFVQSGEAVPREAVDEQPSAASVSPMIVGGTAVPDGKYPFMAALLDKRARGGAFQEQFCGGTLIDKDSVLTAAHCFFDNKGVRDRGIRLQVVVGRTVLSKNQGQLRSVPTIFIHPRYKWKSDAYDAAVLKLSRPVKGIKPLKLAPAKQNKLEEPGNILKAAGWGMVEQRIGRPDIYPFRMREVSVPVVSDSRAKRAYQSKRVKYFPSLMVATNKKGKSICFGDSGGPLFDPGSRTQVGIASEFVGRKCAGARYPEAFTEVNYSSIRNFIDSAAKR